MRRFSILMLLMLSAGTALAQSRPSTPSSPCGVSRQMVISRGAVVLGTGGNTYDRFVRDRSFCQFDEAAEPAFVPSRDMPACFVGYRCREVREWD